MDCRGSWLVTAGFSVQDFRFVGGVFEMRWLSFSTAVFGGRLVRFATLAVLTVIFGKQIVDFFGGVLRNHRMAVVVTAALAVAIPWSLRRVKRPVVVRLSRTLAKRKKRLSAARSVLRPHWSLRTWKTDI